MADLEARERLLPVIGKLFDPGQSLDKEKAPEKTPEPEYPDTEGWIKRGD